MQEISRTTTIFRAIQGQCPRCEQTTLFKSKYLLNTHCSHCHLPIEKEDGWSLGAIPLNYAITCVFWVLPLAVLFLIGILSISTTLIVAGSGCLVIPIATYRFSKKLWLGIYYAVLPHELEFIYKK